MKTFLSVYRGIIPKLFAYLVVIGLKRCKNKYSSRARTQESSKTLNKRRRSLQPLSLAATGKRALKLVRRIVVKDQIRFNSFLSSALHMFVLVVTSFIVVKALILQTAKQVSSTAREI